ALGADHALVHRVRGVALQVADGAIAQPHLDAAAAGAHVARGGLGLVPRRGRQVQGRLVQGGRGHGAYCARPRPGRRGTVVATRPRRAIIGRWTDTNASSPCTAPSPTRAIRSRWRGCRTTWAARGPPCTATWPSCAMR